MEFLELKDIYKTYHLGEVDVPVLRGVTAQIRRGEYVALMGTSGSGKSTLMNLVGCLDQPSSGEYWLDGQSVTKLNADERAVIRNQKLGFVFQNFNLLRRTSALENVIMPLSYSPQPVPDEEALARGNELLNRVGLSDRAHHEPSQLSGGQQQRVAIARALISRPRVLLADEPTGNLDSQTTLEILEMFEKLNVDQGITIILVTHEMDVAARASRIIRLKDGCIESDASPSPTEGAKRKR